VARQGEAWLGWARHGKEKERMKGEKNEKNTKKVLQRKQIV